MQLKAEKTTIRTFSKEVVEGWNYVKCRENNNSTWRDREKIT
jgi:hypothetical protein